MRPVKKAGQSAAKAKATKGGTFHGSKYKAALARNAGRSRGNHPGTPGKRWS